MAMSFEELPQNQKACIELKDKSFICEKTPYPSFGLEISLLSIFTASLIGGMIMYIITGIKD